MGIARIRNYKPYRDIPISRDYNVCGKRVYIGSGQNCGTFWFNSVDEAKAFIDAYYDRIKADQRGSGLIPEELCERCQCHYSSFSNEYGKYRPFACRGSRRS